MKLSPDDQATVLEAERALELAAAAPAKLDDLDAKRRAASDLRWAAIRYVQTLNNAEANARRAPARRMEPAQ